MYLLDAHSLIFQVFHAIPAMTGPKGQPTNAVFGFTGDLLRLRRKNPDYLVCVFDPPGKTFRDDLYPEYKAQRAPMPDDLSAQFPVIYRMLEAMRVPVITFPDFEADDAIATIARQAEAQGIEVFICSSDKDLRQLLTDRVRIYNVRKDVILDQKALQADWGVTPGQVIDYQTLVGDSVDNVPGVPGIGPKTASKLLQEHGSVDNLLKNLKQMKAGKIRDSLEAHAAKFPATRELVRLRTDVPLAIDWPTWRLQPLDTPRLLALFQECGFHRYANEVRAEEKQERAQPGELPFGGQGELFPVTPPKSWDATYHLIETEAKFAQLLSDLRQQKRFAIEVATTTPAMHVGRIAGIAFCWRPGEAHYVALRGPDGPTQLDPARCLEQLRPLLEDASVAKINHNVKQDLEALRCQGIQLAGIAGDPMIASYLLESGERNHDLDELALRHLGRQPNSVATLVGTGKSQKQVDQLDVGRVADCVAESADLAWRLAEALEPKLDEEKLTKLYRDLEVPLIEVLAELEYNGIAIDVPRLRQLGVEFADQLAVLEKGIHAAAGHPFNIASPKQLRQVLFDELKLPSQRKTSITGEASTGQDVLEDLAAAGHELPRKIIEHRQIAKLKGTYVDALPELVNARTGRVHASFNQTVAATGRLSSSDPNLQNIPIRTDLGRQIRQAFIAGEPDWSLLTVDYSQIELRVLAHFSQDVELQRAFRDDRDVHNFVAAQVYGVAETDVTREQRRNAKMVNFGVIYGLSAFGLAARLGISKDEASAFIKAYFDRYPGVLAFQEKLLADARQTGYVTTILGRRRGIQGIRARSTYKQRNQPEREALNTVIQGSAADLIKVAMINVYRQLKKHNHRARMLLQIHDELVFETPQDELQKLATLVTKEMTTAIPLDVPIQVDVAVGKNWLDVEPLSIGGLEHGTSA